MYDSIIITEENEIYSDQVWDLNVQAFGREDEANLVNLLRETVSSYISLTAKMDHEIVGHIMFTPVVLTGWENDIKIAGLGPMAVRPEYQKIGIGSKLIQTGLEKCRSAGYDAVVVLGHPDYYPKFGFTPSVNYGIYCEYDVAPEAFMILVLKRGVLNGIHGVIKYHEAFDRV